MSGDSFVNQNLQILLRTKSTIGVILGLILLAGACSTEKNTVFTRAYHNLTAHYNVFFNGQQSYIKGVEHVRENIQDNYTTLLPVFKASKSNVPSAVNSRMDKAIKKSVKLVKTHSIKAKPKRKRNRLLGKIDPLDDYIEKRRDKFRDRTEYCDWVDDAYLLMGKAHYYKHDYTGAINALKILEREHKYSNLQKKGWLWQAKSYLDMGYMDDAKIYIDKLNNADELSTNLKKEYHLALAAYHIKKDAYNKAFTQLKEAIEYIGKNREKARYHYLMAQISERIQKPELAMEYYEKVISENPPYEMAFNAKISQALAFKGGRASKSIKQDLKDMIKDEKNKEYLDQIYYALANIEKQEGNAKQALDYYKKAARKSPGGSSQKGLIYLALGDIHYNRQNYETSAAYYDSTMTYISDNYANYEQIKQKAMNLGKLARNIKIVKREDSLQKVAQMPEKERMKLINNLIDEEKRRQEQEKRQRQNPGGSRNNFNQSYSSMDERLPGRQNSGGGFYFYNQNMIGRGITEFEKKWGTRKLEDHWRRRNKSAVSTDFEDELSADDEKGGDKLIPEYYKQNLPTNDSLREISEKRKREALYQAGVIYKEKIEDLDAAANAFKRLAKEYSNSSHELEALYQLYQIAALRNNPSAKSNYKNLIVNNFPKSQYAKILSDPDYLKKQKSQKDRIEALYEKAFELYRSENYTASIDQCREVMNEYADAPLIPQFLLLKATNYAELGNENKYRQSLEQIITEHPSSEERQVAEEKLNALEKTRERIAHQQKQIYQKSDITHYVAITFNPQKTDVNQLRFDLLSFNLDFYEDKDFEIQITELYKGTKVLLIKSLKNIEEANAYFEKLKNNTEQYLKASTDYQAFLITTNNYKTLKTDKDMERYLKFFKKTYNF